MKDLRIVFMGTPEFAVSTLKQIIEDGYKVVGVITAPDRPAGRGRKLQQSAVKEYAVAQGLRVLQPTNLKSENFIAELKELNPNVQVVVAFRMLPKEVWQLPELGTFNIHASLLPQYRGAAPINWAIINGETKTGISTFFLDEKIDTGEVILQEEVEISAGENVGDLHDKLMISGAMLATKTLKLIAGEEKVVTKKQQTFSHLQNAPKLTPENTRIDWGENGTHIINLIRGLNPYPAAWSYLINNSEKMRVKIYEAKFEEQKHTLKPGKLIAEDHNLKAAVKNGLVTIEELQLPGKRKMKTRELLNGFHFEKEAYLF